MQEEVKTVNQQKPLFYNEKGVLEINLVYEYLIGFAIGFFFCIYGFYVNNCMKKSRTRRKGVLHGCLLSIFCLSVFCLILLQYCNYVLNLRNQNYQLQNAKGKFKPKMKKILDFGDFVSQKFDFSPKIRSPATRVSPVNAHKYI